jgi:hypothetical protein
LASCLIPKERVHAQVELQGVPGNAVPVILAASAARATAEPGSAPAAAAGPGPKATAGVAAQAFDPGTACEEVPLLRLAYGRSGDKGDTANIGVLARRPEFIPLLAQQLAPEVVRAYLAHLVEGEVERYDWPGLGGWNFVLRRALAGGGVASLRYDPQGKSYAQILMDLPVRVPRAWLAAGGLLGGAR